MYHQAKTSGLAIASLILGILFFVPFGCILAIVFGFIALSHIKHSGGTVKGDGFAIAGIVLGFISLPIMVIGLLAAMAIPAFNKVREQATEKAVMNDASMISTLAQQYFLDENVESVDFATLKHVHGSYVMNSGQSLEGNDSVVEIDGTFELYNPRYSRIYVFDIEGNLIESHKTQVK